MYLIKYINSINHLSLRGKINKDAISGVYAMSSHTFGIIQTPPDCGLFFRNSNSLISSLWIPDTSIPVTLKTVLWVYILNILQPFLLPQSQCHTCDWMPSRFSLWVAQNWSSTLGPGWSPWSSAVPESFFRIFHICPDHWTIRVSIEYNKPRSSGQPVGLRETESGAISVCKNGTMAFRRFKCSRENAHRTITLVVNAIIVSLKIFFLVRHNHNSLKQEVVPFFSFVILYPPTP